MLWKSLGCTWQQQHSLLLKVLTLSLHVSTLSVLSLRSLFWATFSTKGLGMNSTSHKLLYQKQGIEARRLSHSKHWGSGMASTIQRTTQEYHCKIFSFYFATTPPINKNKTQIFPQYTGRISHSNVIFCLIKSSIWNCSLKSWSEILNSKPLH